MHLEVSLWCLEVIGCTILDLDVHGLLDEVYGTKEELEAKLAASHSDVWREWIAARAILTPKNRTVDESVSEYVQAFSGRRSGSVQC